jgi:hypothetical protein
VAAWGVQLPVPGMAERVLLQERSCWWLLLAAGAKQVNSSSVLYPILCLSWQWAERARLYVLLHCCCCLC